MTALIIAGVDVGNATTEVVLADAAHDPPLPLVAERAPTRGRKGSVQAADAAGTLVARTARRVGLTVDEVLLTRQRPVDTSTRVRVPPAPDTGRVLVAPGAGRSPGRPGYGVGHPVWLAGSPPRGVPVVALAPAGAGYLVVAQRLRDWVADGVDLAAAVLADDEGVLVARRVEGTFPVLDATDLAALVDCSLVAVEVTGPGCVLRRLADPLGVVTALHLPDAEREHAVAAVRVLGDCRQVALGLLPVAPGRAAGPRPEPEPAPDAADVHTLDLATLARQVEARLGPATARDLVVATLAPPGPAADAAAVLAAVAERAGAPAHLVGSETAAARAGALTTPGTRPDALVLDLGGGTVDAVAVGAHAVRPGAGEMVSAAVGALLGIPRGAADWVKRGPCSRLDGPHVLLGEDGERTFTGRPAPAAAVGSLVVPGPAGLLPFARDLSPAEWRALRLRLKRTVLGDSVSHALADLQDAVCDVVLVGGVAGDAEILRVLDTALAGRLVGRADVAGSLAPGLLGHRWAVAYGLCVLRER